MHASHKLYPYYCSMSTQVKMAQIFFQVPTEASMECPRRIYFLPVSLQMQHFQSLRDFLRSQRADVGALQVQKFKTSFMVLSRNMTLSHLWKTSESVKSRMSLEE